MISNEVAGIETVRNITEEYAIKKLVDDSLFIEIPYADVVEVIVKLKKDHEFEEEKIEL